MPVPTEPAGWSPDEAEAWARHVPARWARWAVVAAAVTATGVGVGGSPRCTPENDACAADLGFSVSAVFLVASVALLWWRPVVAVACGLVFSVVDVLVDHPWGRVAFAANGLVCVAYGSYVLRCRREQVAAAAAAAVTPIPHLLVAPPAWAGHRDGAGRIRLLAAAALVAVALLSFVLLGRAVAAERAHLDRAVRVEGTVRTVGEDGDLTLRLDRVVEGVPVDVTLSPVETYAVGDVVPLLVDPADSHWLRLVAEPDDPTWWVTVALGALLVAGLLAHRELTGDRARRRLSRGPDGAVRLAVRVVIDPDDVAAILPAGAGFSADVVVAAFPVTERLHLETAEERRLTDPVPAVLYGDIRDGGWCAVVTPDGLVLPQGPVATVPGSPVYAADDPDFDDEDPGTWGSEPTETVIPARLPHLEEASVRKRVLGAVLVVAAAIGAGYVLVTDPSLPTLGLVAGAGALVHQGLSMVLDRIIVAQDAITWRSAWSTERVPLGALEGVRVDGPVVIAYWPGGAVSVEVGDEQVTDWGSGDTVPAAQALARAIDDARRSPSAASDRQVGPSASPGRWVLVLFCVAAAGMWVTAYAQ